MRTIQVPIYKLNELADKVQEEIILNRLIELKGERHPFETPDEGNLKLSTTMEEARENLEALDYLYFADGKVLDPTLYHLTIGG